ncbi:response regulator [Flavilitoribacter nigricans DSM 23189 = NBRC 102662]|uniref:Response regulator n=2 Tax=Flavilitoribacter TaxID=2762562 RepID=A0A2D0NEP9_FLAN2|nr:response regulator [Flavilitoribacter nigricans DSM 23189 = NBRC 102662]
MREVNNPQKLNCVLLVDDDPTTIFLHRWVIDRMQLAHQVKSANDGQEALKLLAQNEEQTNDQVPDLILLDINMPVMNGWEFLDAYEKQNIAGSLPLVIMVSTALPTEGQQKAAKKRDIPLEFLEKPLKKENLLKVVQQHFAMNTPG